MYIEHHYIWRTLSERKEIEWDNDRERDMERDREGGKENNVQIKIK